MAWDEEEDKTVYRVVVNDEEQYSIWPEYKQIPLGWRDVGKVGPKAECLEYIKEVWTDMRPLSLRKKMEESARLRAADPEPAAAVAPSARGDDLVKRLSEGDHPVQLTLRPEKSASALRERIELGYVHVKFTKTRGGTELGVRLDPKAIDLSRADFENQSGTVRLVGGLTLNSVRVRCVADVELATMEGLGHLEPIRER